MDVHTRSARICLCQRLPPPKPRDSRALRSLLVRVWHRKTSHLGAGWLSTLTSIYPPTQLSGSGSGMSALVAALASGSRTGLALNVRRELDDTAPKLPACTESLKKIQNCLALVEDSLAQQWALPAKMHKAVRACLDEDDAKAAAALS